MKKIVKTNIVDLSYEVISQNIFELKTFNDAIPPRHRCCRCKRHLLLPKWIPWACQCNHSEAVVLPPDIYKKIYGCLEVPSIHPSLKAEFITKRLIVMLPDLLYDLNKIS